MQGLCPWWAQHLPCPMSAPVHAGSRPVPAPRGKCKRKGEEGEGERERERERVEGAKERERERKRDYTKPQSPKSKLL